MAGNRMLESDIENSKMTMLGRMISGIAHELNSPIGAVISANQSLRMVMDGLGIELISFIRSLDDREVLFFNALCSAGFSKEKPRGLAIKRNERHVIADVMKNSGVKDADITAETLCDIGIIQDWESYLPLLMTLRGRTVLDYAYRFVQISESSDIISTAAEKTAKMLSALREYSSSDKVKGSMVDLRFEIEILLTLFRNSINHGVDVESDFSDRSVVRGERDALNLVWMVIIDRTLRRINYSGILKISVKEKGDTLEILFYGEHRNTKNGINPHTGIGVEKADSKNLSLVRSIVDEQGGTMVVDGNDSNITVFLKKG
jgi:signal transduction histidine kinase